MSVGELLNNSDLFIIPPRWTRSSELSQIILYGGTVILHGAIIIEGTIILHGGRITKVATQYETQKTVGQILPLIGNWSKMLQFLTTQQRHAGFAIQKIPDHVKAWGCYTEW